MTKDCQFGRVKAYNLPEMLDITLDDHSHYALPLNDLGNGILSAAYKQSKYVANVTTLREDQVTWLCEENFLAPTGALEMAISVVCLSVRHQLV